MPATDLIVIVAAVIAGALVKSVTGMGFPLIAIPVMSLFIPTETAIVVVAIPNLIQNLVIAANHRGHLRDVAGLGTFCGVGVIGAVVGSLTLGVVPEWVTQLVVVALVGLFVAVRTLAPSWALSTHDVRRYNVPVGALSGLLQGAIGISGPIVGAWYTARRLPREAFISAITTVFLLTGLTQIVVFAQAGKFEGRLTVSALLSLIVVSTIPIGTAIRTKVSLVAFERFVLIVLAASCVSILVKLRP